MFSFTLDIYCTSVRPGRGIPHMWLSLRFLLSFYLLKGFFSSFSFLLLRVKGSHTLLKPYETNCGLWIWAIQIQFDWLIDWNIIRTHSVNFHCYADDTQLYLSIKPEQSNQLTKLQACLKDIKTWMTRNFLLLNSDKTEVIILGPKHLRDTLSNDIAALDDIALASNETVRNLGVIFDPDLSFDLHWKQISRTAFFHLRNISKIRNVLTQKDAEKLVHAVVTSRLDYCNSLLSGSSRKSFKTLQLVQNPQHVSWQEPRKESTLPQY